MRFNLFAVILYCSTSSAMSFGWLYSWLYFNKIYCSLKFNLF